MYIFDSKQIPRLLFNMIAPILFWITFIQYEDESISLNLFALLSFGIVFHLFTIFHSNKYSNILIHLNYRLKYLCISFFYSFMIIVLLLLAISDRQFVYDYIVLTPFLLCLVIVGNELIARYEKNIIKIAIIGNSYELSNNDSTLLKNMNIKYTVCEDFDSYNHDETISLVVNNTSNVLEDDKVNYNYKIIDIDKFLESYLRKTTYDKFNSEESNIMRYNYFQFILKKLIDSLVIIFFIPICLVIIPMSFLAVQHQSPGRFIFTQDRIGKNGKIFRILKIKSMHDKTTEKNINDKQRIFPYGSFMRKTRIDEMPQFLNVLFGDMHISGPRAEWIDLHKHYSDKIKNYNLRNNVSPGITGFAQVMFRYGHNEEDAVEKLMFDLYYIKNWSFWLELEIGLRTVMIMLRKKGT